jgi:hypothetical protein
MRNLVLNMTMSLDGYIAGPDGELDWMTTSPDPDLTADTVALLRRADAGFIGYPTAEAMIRYWAAVARDPQAAPASRDIANAVAGMRTYAVSNKPAHIGVPNAEVLVAPDDETLTAAVTAIKHLPGRDLGLPAACAPHDGSPGSASSTSTCSSSNRSPSAPGSACSPNGPP